MGVPEFFRWLSKKYPSIVTKCVEEKPRVVNNVAIPVNVSKPNPNNIEFDNLYIDMNGIIHPSCRPENKPAPKTEDEMMIAIMENVDKTFSMIRPRKLVYLAIDGVAPKAKMNQQRARRFRAAKERVELNEKIQEIKQSLRNQGLLVPEEKTQHFDSNCITPGTHFMHRLAECLKYYIYARMNSDEAWKNLQVILSDSSVPGEGEHKILNFIRRQKSLPGYDKNLVHCIHGADADLIMLGLTTREKHFFILREENKPREQACCICSQVGHEMEECQGLPQHPLVQKPLKNQEFLLVNLTELRHYLEKDLETPLPFQQDFDRSIDDWICLCCFVGNDFLPHLPSLEIREGAIDNLVSIYKKTLEQTGNYLTNNGIVNLASLQIILKSLSEIEDSTFQRRHEMELAFEKKRQQQQKPVEIVHLTGQFGPKELDRPGVVVAPRQTALEIRKIQTEQQPTDKVVLWKSGWKDRYYQNKFSEKSTNLSFRLNVGIQYVLGLCWVIQYYYQKCVDWDWFFPFHYAPFASDVLNAPDINPLFECSTPIRPLEQLMSVFPPASASFLPKVWRELMENPKSSIAKFYPKDFSVDLNGKKFAWQGVALLPFVDQKELLKALENVYHTLTKEEKKRNEFGSDLLFVKNDALFINVQLDQNGVELKNKEIGLGGIATFDLNSVPIGKTVESPITSQPKIKLNQVALVKFQDP